MSDVEIPKKLDVKVSELNSETVGKINKILQRLLAEKDNVRPMGAGFTLHVSL